ncbi:hypothetical protein [Aquimarina sp. MMG016]|uniref:hypothetical protein n=1 Tax=Aquimarina sp. MMG016 TaxID=2822690 RepID=UPI001B39FC93|nr:hypothetical protein [Aquimarina sp. MMG016]MBQ4819402.1 hypothetical protein [Aquimarina sp. MMG016]
MSFTKTMPLFLIFFLFVQCGTDSSEKNILVAPSDDWSGEVIEFPLQFANSLKYSGTEHVLFSPGWGDENAKDYFSYVFLWELEENPELSAEKLESEMEVYFDGLMNMVSKMNLKLFKKIPKSKAFFEKVNDSVFVGKVMTYDAFTTKKEVNLNFIVEKNFCNLQKKHLVLFNISPQTSEHQIWKKMKKVSIDLKCE